MNNNMATNTYLSTTESKKQSKQRRRTETESSIHVSILAVSILMVARWEGGEGHGLRGEGIEKDK